jgi:Electron transfer DM13
MSRVQVPSVAPSLLVREELVVQEGHDGRRRPLRNWIAGHRGITWAIAATVVALVVFVLVWFEPQTLFIETEVDEALPTTSSELDPSDAPSSTEATEILATGEFRALEHPAVGTAYIIELKDGKRFLRFEGLDTSNGPDLRVYLSEVPASDDWYAYGERFIDLGALKGNRGNQNYPLPDDLDLSRYKSAVIWCRKFTVGFGVAGLTEA